MTDEPTLPETQDVTSLAVEAIDALLDELLADPEHLGDVLAQELIEEQTEEILTAATVSGLDRIAVLSKLEMDIANAWAEEMARIIPVIPPEIQAQIDQLEAGRKAQLAVIAARRQLLENEIKQNVLTLKVSVKGREYMAVFTQGRRSVKADDVSRLGTKYAKTNPTLAGEILGLITTGEPTATIKASTKK